MKKMQASPESGLEGQKRSKNGVFVILFDNGSNDLLDFLCVVKSIWGLSISRGPMVKIKSGRPEIGPEGPKRSKNGVLVILHEKCFAWRSLTILLEHWQGPFSIENAG